MDFYLRILQLDFKVRIIIVGCGTVPISLMRAVVQATSALGTAYYREPTADVEELVYKIKNYRGMMNDLLYNAIDFFDDLEDYILPKIKPLFSQVHSRRPINNPIAGRCY